MSNYSDSILSFLVEEVEALKVSQTRVRSVKDALLLLMKDYVSVELEAEPE